MQGLILSAFLALSWAAPPAKDVSLLDAQVLNPGLAMLRAKNPAGVGEESSRVRAWIGDRKEVFLENAAGARRLTVKTGETLSISENLGLALDRMNRYFGMAAATTADPIEFEQLKAALLTPGGIKRIRELFEEEIRQRITVGGKTLVPEIGGEATFSDAIQFHLMDDPYRPVYRRIAAAAGDHKELSQIYEQNPEAMRMIDEHGILKAVLRLLPVWEARDAPPKAKREEILQQTVLTVLESTSDSYVMDPEAQLGAIVSQDWGGRYVGPWHMHPPDMREDGFHAHVENGPSGNDMEIARDRGQNLTIVFYPDGFEVNDLSPLAGVKEVNLSLIKSFTYRSEAWREYFQRLRASLRPE